MELTMTYSTGVWTTLPSQPITATFVVSCKFYFAISRFNSDLLKDKFAPFNCFNGKVVALQIMAYYLELLNKFDIQFK